MESDSDEQLKAWREEQIQIASNVVIPESECQITPIETNGRYKFAHHPISGPILIGGVDVSFQEEGDDAIAVYVILKYDTIGSSPQVVFRSHKWYTLEIPYIPSYLAFREIDPLLELITSQIEEVPDLKPNVIFVDGNGQWHERKAGIATFVGVKTGIPTVGIGKTFYSIDGMMDKMEVQIDLRRAVSSWYEEMALCDGIADVNLSETSEPRHLILDTVAIPAYSKIETYTEKDVSMEQMLTALHSIANGIAIPMKGGENNNNEVMAYALLGHAGNTPQNKNATDARRGSTNPIYVSVGSNISLEDAVILCSHLCIARIPEPVREADLYGRQIVREKQTDG